MAENADVLYTIRADSSRLEADLSRAESIVRQSAQRSEQALDGIAQAAESSGEHTAAAVESVAQSAQETAEALGDVAEAAADTAENVGSAAQQAEQSFGDISAAAEQTGEAAAAAADEAGSSAQVTAQAFESVAEAAESAGESAASAGEELARAAEEAASGTEETEKKYKTLGEELEEVNKLLEKDGKNSALSAQKKELLKKAIAETSEKLKHLKDRQSDVNKAYRNGDIPADEYREFQREVAATEQELRGYRDELQNVGKASDEAGDKTAGRLSAAFGAVGTAVAAATAAAAAGAAALGTAAVSSADSLDKAARRAAASVGAGEDAVRGYADVIRDIYADNYGEGFDDIAESVSAVTRNLGEMDAEPLKKVAESAYALQDIFDMGVDESSRAARAMSENFGIAADKAYDYIAKGAQEGLDYSGELLDSISEYSVQFAKLGFSADDMFSIFAQGAENGAWNLDKIGDAVKEFSVRAIDGSESTKAGFEALGYDAEDMAAKFAQGGDVARDAFRTVVKALGDMSDPIAQNTAGVNLFGTMWEDLGADAVKALGEISDEAYGCEGAVNELAQTGYGSLSDAIEGLKRQAEVMIQPLGEALIPIVSGVVEGLSGMAEELIPQLTELVQPVIERLGALVEPIMELIASVLPQLVELAAPLVELVSDMVQTLLPPLTEFLSGELIPAIMDVVKWLEKNLFPVIKQIMEKLLPPLLKIVSSLLPLIEVALDLLEPVLGIVEALIEPVAAVLDALSPIVTILTDLVRAALEPLQRVLGESFAQVKELAPFLEEVLGRALKIVAELLGDTLLPAFEGLIQFLSGDFMGACETWGEGFERTMRNVFEHIDEIFGTHLAEWYDEFNAFWRDVGAKLYEFNHADEIEQANLDAKYSNLGNAVIQRSNELMRLGSTAEEALNRAISEKVDTDEKAYYWKEHFADLVTVDEAESRRRQMQANGTLRANYYNEEYSTPATIAGSWYEDYYKEIAARSSAQAEISQADLPAEKPNAGSEPSAPAYTYTPYTAQQDAAKSSSSFRSSAGGSGSGSRSSGTFVSVTSYVPTIWDSDQTAALKSLIGKDVLGNTTSAHQINALTGVTAENTAASTSGETTLADVVNAITKLQRRVEKMEDAVGDATIILKAGDLTLGKAAVRDINSMAKQSGKSPFNF